jgi:hypothetical protein
LIIKSFDRRICFESTFELFLSTRKCKDISFEGHWKGRERELRERDEFESIDRSEFELRCEKIWLVYWIVVVGSEVACQVSSEFVFLWVGGGNPSNEFRK